MGGGGQVHGGPFTGHGRGALGGAVPTFLCWSRQLCPPLHFSLWMKLEEQVPLLIWTLIFQMRTPRPKEVQGLTQYPLLGVWSRQGLGDLGPNSAL